MAAEGGFVVDPCVGSHFTAPLIPGPVFGGAHQGGANFPVAGGFVDEPAFDEADWAGWVAAVGMGAQADFDKAGECSGFVLRNENGHGERAVHTDAEASGHSIARIIANSFWSERCACLTSMVNACSALIGWAGWNFVSAEVETWIFALRCLEKRELLPVEMTGLEWENRSSCKCEVGRAKAYIPPIASARWMGHPVCCGHARESGWGCMLPLMRRAAKLRQFFCSFSSRNRIRDSYSS
jgi:hypothetical protein